MNWLERLFGEGADEILEGIGKLFVLANKLDSIAFTQESWLYQFIGLIRYLLGDPLFIELAIFFDICIGFALYKVVKGLVAIVSAIFPKIKGKFIVP